MKRLLSICMLVTFFSAFTQLSYTQEQAEDNDPVFTVVEEMPEFPGGAKKMLEFIKENMQYPASALENGLQGRVIVTFVVQKDGSISEIKVSRGIDTALDEEAIRIVKSMPAWESGKQRGEPVKVRYTLPIVFRLP